MGAAFDKAQNYCAAGGAVLGRILHIEDVNPLTAQTEMMGRGGGYYGGHYSGNNVSEYDGDVRAFDPSLIEVAAAVYVSYEIKEL
jgi:hypothetical protein